MLWLVHHRDDMEADFLVFYRIRNPWTMRANQMLPLARRLFYYTGALQALALEEQEKDENAGSVRSRGESEARYHDGVDMRHNAAAAKAAAKGLKGDDHEVKYVPVEAFMGMLPPGTGEHVTVN